MTKAPPPPKGGSKKAPVMDAKTSTLRAGQPGALAIEKGRREAASRLLIYGAGGIGKTTLAAQMPKPLFIDLESGTNEMDVDRVRPGTWQELRTVLATLGSDDGGYKSVVFDSATRAEELAGMFVLAKHGTGDMRAIDELPYGRGPALTGAEMLQLIGDLDRIAENGMHVCVVAHELAATVPSPVSEDFLRAEPALYAGDKRGRNAVRNRFVQWADSVVWLSIDRYVKEGKAHGTGSRTAYTHEAPSFVAKSRVLEEEFSIEPDNGAEFWHTLGVS